MTKVFFDNIDEIIISHLNESKFEIKIAVAWITDQKIIKTLEKCVENGILVKIIFYNDNINKFDNFKQLYKKGAIIRCSNNLMHNKFCIIDNKKVINGSYNWTISAKSNNENIQITNSSDIASDFEKEFNKILKNTLSVDKYFANNEDAINRYIESVGSPLKYPVFYKLELVDKIRSFSFSISDINELEKFDYVYKLFYNENDFLDFLIKVYNVLFTNKKDKQEVSLFSYIKSEDKNFSSKSLNIILDIIKENDIGKINNILPENILQDKFRMSHEKFVYLQEIKKENILLISFTNGNYSKNNCQLQLISIKNTNDSNKVFKLFFDELHTNDDYIILSQNVFRANWSPQDNKKIVLYDYRFFFNKRNFLFDDVISSTYNNNQEIIREEIRNNSQIRQNESRRNVQKYNRNECYIATMVYKDENHLNIHKLRKFRDTVLLNNFFGFQFIRFYYIVSPWLVLIFNNCRLFNLFFKLVIEKFILKLIKT